jgi:hypothetical protein
METENHFPFGVLVRVFLMSSEISSSCIPARNCGFSEKRKLAEKNPFETEAQITVFFL